MVFAAHDAAFAYLADQPQYLHRHLIEGEEAERKAHSIRYQMCVAKFPLARDLDGFIFEDAQVERTGIEGLHQGQFMELVHNLLFAGGTETGKTHLAIAIGRHAVRQGKPPQKHHAKKHFTSYRNQTVTRLF